MEGYKPNEKDSLEEKLKTSHEQMKGMIEFWDAYYKQFDSVRTSPYLKNIINDYIQGCEKLVKISLLDAFTKEYGSKEWESTIKDLKESHHLFNIVKEYSHKLVY